MRVVFLAKLFPSRVSKVETLLKEHRQVVLKEIALDIHNIKKVTVFVNSIASWKVAMRIYLKNIPKRNSKGNTLIKTSTSWFWGGLFCFAA